MEGRAPEGSASGEARPDLFSEGLVHSYVDADARFVERPWLGRLIVEKLADPGCRFLLLTGEPGSGKTALAAWLARQNRGWLRYFIRRDSRVPLNSGDARSLLFALGHQLATLRPGLFRPDRLEVIVRQHVDEVAAGGRAVALRVEDLEVSPFYETALRVEQTAGRVAGELAGVEAGRIVAEERFLDISNLQFLALLDPAALLLHEEPDARLVVLIDGLDELRYGTGGESALDWLASCPELPANVRFLLTSRPDDRLLARFRGSQEPWLRESPIDADPDEVEADHGRYAASFATEQLVARALAEESIAPARFVAVAVARADGNFEYLAALFRGIDHALAGVGSRMHLRRLLRLEEVPTGLAELYAFFLSLVRDAVGDERVELSGAGLGEIEWLPAWEALYQPFLGMLAVAYEPLTADQIRRLGRIGVEERWLIGALGRLEQFLDRDRDRYALYHASFAEYLTAETTRETHPDDHLEPGEWHARIGVQALAACGKDWLVCEDGYALAYAPAHLAAAIRGRGDGPRRDELAGLLTQLLSELSFLEAKATALGVDALLADVADARAAVPDDRHLRELARTLDLEAHHLRQWDPAEEPAYFAQQLQYRAAATGTTLLAEEARERLDQLALPYLALRWRAAPKSPAHARTLAGHIGRVTALALTGDGRAVSASTYPKLMVWDLTSGRRLGVLAGHGDWVNAVALTADGRAVSASSDRTLRVWDLESGRELHVLAGHQEAVHTVALTADGRVVSGSEDGTLRVWDLDDGQELRVLAGHEGGVSAVALTADGRAVSGSELDAALRVWDLASGRELHVLAGHEDSVTAVAITVDGWAISGSFDWTLRVWDPDRGQGLRVLAGHEATVNAVALTADGRAVSASGDRTLRVWDLESGRELHVLAGHQGAVNAVAITGDGRVASGAEDGTLRVWDLESGRELHVLAGHEASVNALAVTGDDWAVSGSDDGTLRVWEIVRGQEPDVLAGHKGAVSAVALTADGRAVSASSDQTLRVWDVVCGRELHVLAGHEGSVTEVALTADGRAVSASGDRTLRVWDLESGRELHVLAGHEGSVTEVALTADGRAVSASGDRTLRVWDLESGRELHVLSGHKEAILAVALTADGRAVSASGDRTLRVWDLESGRELHVLAGHEGAVYRVAVTPNGRAVSVARDRTLRLWDVEDGQELRVLSGHEGWVTAVAVTDDGRAVSASSTGTLRIGDLESGNELHVLARHDGSVTALAVIDHPRRLLSAYTDRSLRCWTMDGAVAASPITLDAGVTALAASPDGQTIVAGDRAGSISCFQPVGCFHGRGRR